MKRNFPPESFQIRAALSQSLPHPSGKNHLIKIYPRAKTIVVSLRMYKTKKMERSKLWIFSITFHNSRINEM